MQQHTSIIVIDLQNDYFPGGKFPLPQINQATKNAVLALDSARQNGDYVIHIQHINKSEAAPFLVKGSIGAEINGQIRPREGEPVVVKHHANLFRDTGFKQILEEHSIGKITLVGAMSNMCIDAAARAGYDFGYEIVVLHDACAASDLSFNGSDVSAVQVHNAYMAALAFGYAEVISTREFVELSDQNAKCVGCMEQYPTISLQDL